jgi:hypothetical protein
VWARLGREPFARFISSYREHDAGMDHRLLLVFKEFRDPGDELPWRRELEGVAFDELRMPQPALDLSAYVQAARHVEDDLLCFLNSSSEPLAECWLAKLAAPHARPEVGLTGASGSYESAYTEAPRYLKPLRRRHFPAAPNPHLRTNAFALDRRLMLELEWPHALRKVDAWRLESGRRSLTRQVLERGLGALVVDRQGREWGPGDWRASETFRSGEQAGLLVADNRTRQYADAAPGERRRLARMAWGDPGG